MKPRHKRIQDGELIRKKREQLGLTREEFATKIGVKVAMVGHIENGVRPVPVRRAPIIEKVLGIPREQFAPEVFGEAA